jgi:hypothetical protein
MTLAPHPVAQSKPAPPTPTSLPADPTPASAFSTLTAPMPVAARESAPERQPATPAVVATFHWGLGAGTLLSLGCLLLGSAIFLIAVVMRRLRPSPQASFITQSMDRR